MKRGRKSLRSKVSPLIIEILSDNNARSLNSITTELSKRLGKRLSWNTAQKYIEELIEMGRVVRVVTPHSKIEDKNGLTVYQLKR